MQRDLKIYSVPSSSTITTTSESITDTTIHDNTYNNTHNTSMSDIHNTNTSTVHNINSDNDNDYNTSESNNIVMITDTSSTITTTSESKSVVNNYESKSVVNNYESNNVIKHERNNNNANEYLDTSYSYNNDEIPGNKTLINNTYKKYNDTTTHDNSNSYSYLSSYDYSEKVIHPIHVKSYSHGNIIYNKSLEERLDEDIISEHVYINEHKDNNNNNNDNTYNMIYLTEMHKNREKINKDEFSNSKTILKNNMFLHKMFPLVTDLDIIIYFRSIGYNDLIRIFRTFHSIEDIKETYINDISIYSILKRLNNSHKETNDNENKHVTFPNITMENEVRYIRKKYRSSNLKKECVIDRESINNNYQSVKRTKEDCCDWFIKRFCCC